jgi:ribulose-phosphate 3-epimerase
MPTIAPRTSFPILVAPSLLAADFSRLTDEIKRVEEAGADFLHLDIMDGHFVPNISFGLPVIQAIRRVTHLKFDVHLMLSQPRNFVDAFHQAGADSLTVHIEVEGDTETLLDQVQTTGMECGLALNPQTPIELLYPFLNRLDLALIMSVKPGFGGQAFMPEALDKVKDLHQEAIRQSLDLPIQIDGGITPQNAPLCRAAGVRWLVAGSSIFGDSDATAAIAAIRG